MSLSMSVMAAVLYLSVSADFFVLVDLDGLFRMLSACVCAVCVSFSCHCVLACTNRKNVYLQRRFEYV